MAGDLCELCRTADALVELTGRRVPPKRRRRRGVLMHVAWIGAYLPNPNMATYTATKAFVLSFTGAIAVELGDSGVQVLCVCPGVTRTEFQERAHVETGHVPGFVQQTADEVADEAVRAVGHGPVIVNGVLNRITVNALKFVPHALATRLAGGMIRPQE